MIRTIERVAAGLMCCVLVAGCNLDSMNPDDNLLPEADAGPDITAVDADGDGAEEVTLDATASNDPDGSISNYAWTEDGRAIAVGATPRVMLPAGRHTIMLVVTDNDAGFATDEVVVSVVSADNEPPIADAGPDMVVVDEDLSGNERVRLDASRSSDPDGHIVDVQWTMGSNVVKTDGQGRARFPLGVHEVTLTVTDNRGAQATDVIEIRIVSPDTNLSPVASAGSDVSVVDTDSSGSEVVTLDGSASSDPDGSIVSWVWTENGSEIASGMTASVDLSLGAHAITLTVTDNEGATDTDMVHVEITEIPANRPPTASAGADQSVPDTDSSGSEPVALDGSASSDPDGSIVSWVWSEAGGEIATGATPVLDLAVGAHEITLTVTDNEGLTGTDLVRIEVTEVAVNQPPTADAGADQVVSDANGNGTEQIALDGSRSADPDGSIVSWIWTEGGTQIATGATAIVTFAVGVHEVMLTVTDDSGATATDLVRIEVVAVNRPPTADAGPDQTVTDSDGDGMETVALDGSGSSDPDGSISRWSWSAGGGEIATGATPSVSLAVGTHTITLTVTDDAGDTASDAVVVTVEAPAPSVSYATDIQPYFNDRCIGCHGTSGIAGVSLVSWQSVTGNPDLLTPGDASQGVLLQMIRGGHQGAPHGTTIEQDLTDWINAGAPNN